MSECETQTGQRGTCITFFQDDWRLIRLYYQSIERELRAACLALGGTPAECEGLE